MPTLNITRQAAPKLSAQEKKLYARLEKPKSMRYVRRVMNPIFEEAQAKFGDAIAEIVEREHWGPNFDAYYDVWVRRRAAAIDDFFSDKLLDLQLEKYAMVLVQVEKAEDYREPSRRASSTTVNHNGRNHRRLSRAK
jgi:hypothetical protein